MRLRYENTMEDVVAFQEHYCAQSPAIRRQIAGWKWGGAALILAGVFLIGALITPGGFSFIPFVVGGSIGAGGYLLLYPWWTRRRCEQFARRLYAEGENKSVLCWHELELCENGFIERTPHNENKAAWSAIERIDAAPGYTFVYIGAGNAYVLPHDRILEGDLQSFLTELGRRFQVGTAPTGINRSGTSGTSQAPSA